jgi:hypothetical protein
MHRDAAFTPLIHVGDEVTRLKSAEDRSLTVRLEPRYLVSYNLSKRHA